MMRIFWLAMIACAVTSVAAPNEVPAPPLPPLPAVSQAGPELPLPAELALPVREPLEGQPAPKKARKPPPPKIVLGEKKETDLPEWRGAGLITPAKFQIKADGGKMTALLTGGADSSSYYGLHSLSVATIQLVQEFDIEPGNPANPRVVMALSGKLDGFVSATEKATACLRRADAVVYPACGGPALTVAFPPCCALPGEDPTRCEAEVEAPPIMLPAGRYILVANLVLETTVDGHLRKESEAIFSPKPLNPNSGSGGREPHHDFEEEDFGLLITLKATAPPD